MIKKMSHTERTNDDAPINYNENAGSKTRQNK